VSGTYVHDLGGPLNISDLARLFGIDQKEVRKRLSDVVPVMEKGAQRLYRCRDVAPRLCKLEEKSTDLVSRILATHHTDLPKMLSKEYWYGQNQRIRFLKDTGDLWSTSAVVDLASEVFKVLRLSLMLSSDTVERETGLTVRQREIIEDLMHGALNEAREKLVVRLNESRKNSAGKAFAPKESSVPDANGRSGNSGNELDDWGDPIIRRHGKGNGDTDLL
jgi:hypothetical protein